MIKEIDRVIHAPAWDNRYSERVMGIEPALSAWEYHGYAPICWLTSVFTSPLLTLITLS
jgi:hypothetical protein